MKDTGQVIDMLEERIGLCAESIGVRTIEQAWSRVQDGGKAGMTDLGGAEQIDAMIECSVVPETWFFRDVQPFALLRNIVRRQSDRSAKNPVRILSAPCSTGEEAYSIAVGLLDAEIASDRFEVLGVDVSRQALVTAKRGVYSSNSFRGTDFVSRNRWFDRVGADYRVIEAMRRKVVFRHANMVEPGFLTGERPFDIVFCRNLLIYMSQNARRRLLANLERLLTGNGILFVGHSEMHFFMKNGFEPVDHPGSFACRRMRDVSCKSPDTPRRSAGRPCFARSGAGRKASCERRTRNTVGSSVSLDEIRQIADSGRIRDAMQMCMDYMGRKPESAEAHTLMGLMHEAGRNAGEALRSYTRALYIDPDCREALAHMALIHESRGETDRASACRAHMARITAVADDGEGAT